MCASAVAWFDSGTQAGEGWGGQPGPAGMEEEKRIVFPELWVHPGSCPALRERADGWERQEEAGGLSPRLGSAVWEDL